MIDSFTTWFKSRTAREQLLLSAAAMIILGGGALLVAYQAASSYRASAAADLAAALQMRDDLTRLKSLEGGQASAPLPNSDGSVRGIVVAAASQFGLAPARIEPRSNRQAPKAFISGSTRWSVAGSSSAALNS